MPEQIPSPDPKPPRLRIGFLLTSRFTLSAYATFVDVLRLAADEGDGSRPIRCSWRVLSSDMAPVQASCGARIEVVARVTERIEPGHVFTAFHFPEVRTNLLIGASADVNTSCPEYKVVAVDVRPVAEEPARTPAIGASA